MRLVAFLPLALAFACSSPSGGGDTPNNTGSGGSGGTSGGSGGTAGGTGGTSGGTGGTAGGTAGGTGGTSGGTGGTAGGTGGSAGSGGSGGGVTGWTCPAGPFDRPFPEGSPPTPTQITAVPPNDGYVTTGFYNIEGPVWIDDALYVSQILAGEAPPSRILKIVGDTVTEFLETAGTNGLAVDGAGKLYGARHTDGAIAQIDLATPTTSTVIAGMYGTPTPGRFNSPNDLAIRSDGNIYFSDPDYQKPAGTVQAQTRVYRIAPETNEVTEVDATLTNPNGVTLSLDENTLFVSSQSGSNGGRLWKYTVNGDGTTTGPTMLSASLSSDGMVIDCAGNLYLTMGKEVVILDPTGMTEIDRISVAAASGDLTNVAFGGAEHKTLFITFMGNTGGVYKVDLAVPGKPY